MQKLTLALLSGGKSPERDVSISSGDGVRAALDPGKYNIRNYDPATDLDRLVQDAPEIDVALIILHGPYGEDGTIQGLLELLDIPYQGSGVLGSAAAANKRAAKQLYLQAGIPTPAHAVCYRSQDIDGPDLIRKLGLPLVVKPASGGSSLGMSIVKSPDAIPAALEKAFAIDREVVVEAYIKGIELTGAVIGNQTLNALPIVEIVPGAEHEFFDYTAKYKAGATQEICPARLPADLSAAAQAYALAAHKALFCNGYSRTDMILQGSHFYILETNTIPGMTPTSLLPLAARAAGYTYGQLLDELIRLALERHRG